MNRAIFQHVSAIRRRDALALLRGGRYVAAYYLIGYAVECALKACIAKQVRRHDFSDKRLANEVFTHNLEKLMKLSGLHLELRNGKQQGT
jgi:hypothetical protein